MRHRGFVAGALAATPFLLACGLAAAPGAADAPPAGARAIDWQAARRFWSFVPPHRSTTPPVRDRSWSSQPIDYFVLARLERRGLRPSPPAAPQTLIRRLAYDLTGLPPEPADVDAFAADPSPAAFARLVDRLLASPRFGERMASFWLPLARYAEDQAHQVGDDTKFFYPNAGHYRSWVAAAFNRDLPYDRFIRLQLAADRAEGAEKSDLAALGFLGLGPKYYNRNRLEVMADEWQDRVDTVTRAFLGLTVACARCHDHKFDPVTMRDYYALAGVFASTKMVNKGPDGTVDPATDAAKMRPDTLHIVEDDSPRDLAVFARGNVENPGPVAPRGYLQILSMGDPPAFRGGSGRAELADAIASPSNPLTARVFVNRIWALFFGRGLVGTPSNFGATGDRPTHPELLDDLAVRFVEGGWSVKSLVRELVLSSAYRQSSADRPEAAAKDPSNSLFWRMPRRRLSVEQWRDTVLAVSGRLDLSPGPSREADDPANVRRTLYSRISRLKLNDMLMQFDYPDANVHAEARSTTTTPIQKLFLLNSPFMLETAAAFARHNLSEGSPAQKIRRSYARLFAREPRPEELALGISFLSAPESPGASRAEQYAQVLLLATELQYLD